MGLSFRAWIRQLSLGRKLTAISILTSATSLVIAAVVLVAYDRASSRERLLVDTVPLGDVVGNNSTAALTFSDAKAANETLRVVAVNGHILSAAILSVDGRVLAHYERPGAARFDRPLPALMVSGMVGGASGECVCACSTKKRGSSRPGAFVTSSTRGHSRSIA